MKEYTGELDLELMKQAYELLSGMYEKKAEKRKKAKTITPDLQIQKDEKEIKVSEEEMKRIMAEMRGIKAKWPEVYQQEMERRRNAKKEAERIEKERQELEEKERREEEEREAKRIRDATEAEINIENQTDEER